MEIKCPTCGMLVKNSTICPRCRTELNSCLKCSGNCLKCQLKKK
ncbi:hypothetical protein [Caloramator sp.]|nr:hypothetical protein [Caloramator sp.]